MTAVKNILNKLREFTIAQRSIAMLLTAVLLALIAGGIFIATRPTMTPLFSNLSGQDASAVVEQLASNGTSYELADGGATILVPKQKVNESRMAAAAKGLPTTSSGAYSLLDTLGATASEFQQDTTWQRVLQNQIADAIKTLDGVEEASVTITIPEETVFVSTKEPATASIVVRTGTGVTLNDEQVNSILHIVAGSVKGMDRANIAISDTSGKLLSAIGGDTDAIAAKKAAEHEARIGQNISRVLDRVVGAGNSTVSVVAEMSSESAEQVSESFGRPENGTPPLTEKNESEQYEGTGGSNGGVLGTDNVTTEGGNGGEGEYKSEKNDKTNAVNKVTENRVVPSGQLQRQSISVVIDQNVAGNLNQEDITAAVTNAAGLNAERGDQLTVRMIPFDTTAAERRQAELEAARAEAEAQQQQELIRNAIIGGSILLGAILLAVVIFIVARKSRKEEPEQDETVNTVAAPTVEPLADQDSLYEDSYLGTTAMPVVEEEPVEQVVDVYKENLEGLKRRAEQDPKAVAGHFKSIIAKDGK